MANSNETQFNKVLYFKNTGAGNYCLIPIGCFEESKAKLLLPKKNTSGNNPSWYTSSAVYLDDDGVEYTPYFHLPSQFAFGINANYDTTISKDVQERDKGIYEKADGFQVCYFMTSNLTMSSPTDDEKYIRNVFDCLWEKTLNVLDQIEKDESIDVPACCRNSYLAAKMKLTNAEKKYSGKLPEEERKKILESVIKPMYSYPKVLNSKPTVYNTEKPLRAYLKLISFGKGSKGKAPKVVTKFYKSGQDEQISYLELMEDKGRGRLFICCKWEGAYWGSHGIAPHIASVKTPISEATFTPSGDRFPSIRMTPTSIDGGEVHSLNDDDFFDPRGVDQDDFEKEEISKVEVEDEELPAKTVKKSKKRVPANKKKSRKITLDSDSE